MNEKFTTGPWNKKEINICSQHKAGLSLAFLTTSDWRKQEEGKANAHLIAASPELYDALNTIHNWLVCASITTAQDMAQSFPEMELVARNALAKARGES